MANPFFLKTRKKTLHPTIRPERTVLISRKTIKRLAHEKRLNDLYFRMEETGLVPFKKWDELLVKPVGFWKEASLEDKKRGLQLEIRAPEHIAWGIVEEFKANKMDKEEDVIH